MVEVWGMEEEGVRGRQGGRRGQENGVACCLLPLGSVAFSVRHTSHHSHRFEATWPITRQSKKVSENLKWDKKSKEICSLRMG